MPYHKYYQETKDVTVANGGTVSAAFYIPNWAIFVGVYIPAMDNGNLGMAFSFDGTNYYDLLDPTDGSDAVLCASGQDAGFVDISDWVRFVPSNLYCRFTCAAQASGAVTMKVLFRG